MSQEELIADTNRLLNEYLEMQREFKLQQEESAKRFEEQIASMRSPEPGLADQVKQGKRADLDSRISAAQDAAQEKFKTMRELQSQYQEQLMAELKTQSDLLAKIAAKIGA